MSMIIRILLLGQLITMSIQLYAADPSLIELDSKKGSKTFGPPLTLETLCLQALKKLPPEHLEAWRDMPLNIKQRFIIEHGLTYKPRLFVLDEATQRKDRSQTDGIIKNNQLRLCNRFAQVIIGNQKSQEHDSAQNNEEQLPTCELFDPEFTCACLQDKHIYVGSESGGIYHYSIEHGALKTVDVQQISSNSINYTIANPSIEHLISYHHSGRDIGNICIVQKNKQGAWVNQKELIAPNHIGGMAFSPDAKWLACIDSHNVCVCVYDLASASRDAKHKVPHGSYRLDTLLFKDDETLLMNSKGGKRNNQEFTVWNFRTDAHTTVITACHTPKIILAPNKHYGLDKDFENNEWVTHVSSSILFRLVLDNIQSRQELDRFKKYKDKLHCGEQPLFKLHAIMNKTRELQKAEAKRKHSVDMRKSALQYHSSYA